MTRYLKDSSFSSRFNFPTTSVLDSKRIFEKIPIRSSKISGTREIFFNRRQILRTKRLSLMPKNFESCLFLKKNLGIFGEDFGACPNEFEAPPPPRRLPPSEFNQGDIDSGSECSDIVISSDDESWSHHCCDSVF